MRTGSKASAISKGPATSTSGHASALSGAKQALLDKWMRGESLAPGDPLTRSIPRRLNAGNAPLSFGQQRLWFYYQLAPESPVYNMPIALRLRGPLNPELLRKAMDAVAARHVSLRTRFVGETPTQSVTPPSPVPMTFLDLRGMPDAEREAEARRRLELESKRPFNLEQDLLIRWMLIRLEEEEWLLLVMMHHIASDDWSWRVICREIAALYESFVSGNEVDLPQPAVEYADYAAWQGQWLRGEVLEQQLMYWRRQLADAPAVLELPSDHPRPAVQSFRGRCEWRPLPPGTAEKLSAFSQSSGTTPFTILLAAFQSLLHRYTGQEEILVGSPVAGRTRINVENVVGLFVNMLVLRTRLSADLPFAELLARTQQTVLEALAQQELPFEKLIEELHPHRSASFSPVIQVMFALQEELSESLRLPGLASLPYELDPGVAKFDLTLSVIKGVGGLNCCAEYNTDLFEPGTIRQLLEHYERLLEGILADPRSTLSGLPLLTGAERRRLLVEWNNTDREYARDKCVHELFEAQARATPDGEAVVFGNRRWTYAMLNRRANQLAHRLPRLGVTPESRVAVCLDRSPEMVVAIMGTLKAGAAYVPLDPSYPSERIEFMLSDSAPSVLLTGSGQEQRLESLCRPGLPVICLDANDGALDSEPEEDPPRAATPASQAYVIYTSGSTGRPKGVQVPHCAVVNFLQSMQHEPGITAADTLLSVTSISFDIAGLEVFLPLITGARLVLAGRDTVFDMSRLAGVIRDSGATVMQATPSLWRMLVESGWAGEPRLKVLCGGEPLSRTLADALLARAAAVWNLYGPTETTIWSAVSRVQPGEAEVTVGRPISNTRFYVLDATLQPVPVAVAGELHIGGEGVACGYLNQPELTAARFISNPFSAEPRHARLYRTGDMARYRPDGQLEYLGRTDDQVKLHGHRIDLGEIQSTLRQCSGVRDSLVMLRATGPGQHLLVGYVLCAADSMPDPGELRRFLRSKLPGHMVPGAFVLLDRFPLLPNGKVDRKALPAPSSQRAAQVSSEPMLPRTPAEQALAALWREILRLDAVGIHDNFFELGGHSLLAMQMVSRARAELQIDFSLHTVFETPTIAGLAQHAGPKSPSSAAGLPSIPRSISTQQARDLLGRLDELSDDEVELLLRQTTPNQSNQT